VSAGRVLFFFPGNIPPLGFLDVFHPFFLRAGMSRLFFSQGIELFLRLRCCLFLFFFPASPFPFPARLRSRTCCRRRPSPPVGFFYFLAVFSTPPLLPPQKKGSPPPHHVPSIFPQKRFSESIPFFSLGRRRGSPFLFPGAPLPSDFGFIQGRVFFFVFQDFPPSQATRMMSSFTISIKNHPPC